MILMVWKHDKPKVGSWDDLHLDTALEKEMKKKGFKRARENIREEYLEEYSRAPNDDEDDE